MGEIGDISPKAGAAERLDVSRRSGSSGTDRSLSPTFLRTSPSSSSPLHPPPAASSVIYQPPDASPKVKSSPLLDSGRSSPQVAHFTPSPPLFVKTSGQTHASGSVDAEKEPAPASGLSLGAVFARRGSIVSRQVEPLTMLVPRRKGKEREGIEMVEVPQERVPVDRVKQDIAMAKWRKWVIEQPMNPTPGDVSSLNNRKASASLHIPHSPGDGSPREPAPHSATPLQSRSPAPISPMSRVDSDEAVARLAPHSNSSTSSRQATIPQFQGEFDFYTTESVRALRDVELAIDDAALARSLALQSKKRSMSTKPRISLRENPFIDIASRLSSRRVRPIVLELIHSLGHYIDAVWTMTYPSIPIPWAAEFNSPRPSSNPLTWKSPMLTAVQEGKRSGHVTSMPSEGDVQFYRDEVRYAIRDVDDTVGIFKGIMWGFMSAFQKGDYGFVEEDNILGEKGSGGNIARLLNDLEEALWCVADRSVADGRGDAPPRSTDLAYELPPDFDPYAPPDPEELLQTTPEANPFTTFLLSSSGGHGSGNGSGSETPASVPPGVYAMPDLVDVGSDRGSDGPSLFSPHSQPGRTRRTDSTPSEAASQMHGAVVAQAWGVEQGGTEMTLEEIGRKRHEEWLASRRAGTW